MPEPPLSRRRFLQGVAVLPAAVLLSSCDDDGPEPSRTTGSTLPATPACDDGDEPTPSQTEGPYFTPDSPERANLREAGVAGSGLVLSGRVLDTSCRPIRSALLDFWQADGDGEYDNEGYRLRGHQFTDSRGRFSLETVVPGLYPGRTRHIHVKAQRRGGEVLTTQLYFPGEAQNDSDPIFDDALLMDVRASRASFTFVLT